MVDMSTFDVNRQNYDKGVGLLTKVVQIYLKITDMGKF